MTKAEAIVARMMDKDYFSQWLGIEVEEVRPGYARLNMTARKEMLNGHQVLHGGISFSLADSALAFASNGHGQKALSIDASINHTKPVFEGDEIIAEAEEENLSRSVGNYIVRVKRNEEVVALFKGVVFRKKEEWEVSTNI